MIKYMLAAGAAAGALALLAVPASAETLNVQGVVAPYCNINLANVSSGTASIAMVSEQQVANLKLACNAAGGERLVLSTANGDLVNGNVARINYAMRLTADDPAFNIAQTDTAPSGGEGHQYFTRVKTGYNQAIANGINAQLFMNVNVATDPNQPDFNGTPLYPANAAPAGTYSETFTFTLTGL